MSPFILTMENFEGPIDLLLHMIEKRKMPINDISLSAITEEYLTFLKNLDQVDMSNKTHFVYIASTLTLIKSKSLLPKLELSDEEKGDIENLKKRLELLKIFQIASDVLKKNIKPHRIFFYPKNRKHDISFDPPENIKGEDLFNALVSTLKTVPQKQSTKKEASLKIVIHIEEIMNSLLDRVSKIPGVQFKEFIHSFFDNENFSSKEQQGYYIVGFLAVLELAKKGTINVHQEHNFNSITINTL